ncbi:MAG TPA: hypothetical protein VF615_08040 [Longimicrobiaceae bacterium]
MKLPPLARSVLVALGLSLPIAAYAGWTRAQDRQGLVREALAVRPRPTGWGHVRVDHVVRPYLPVGASRDDAIRVLRERGFRVTVERMPLPYRGGVLEKECPHCTEQLSARYEQSLLQGIHAVGVLVGVRDGRVAYVQGALVRQGILL